ncbi:glycosyltransferase [Candidatus Saccharibacteria bacterium]|nr:glycosyltransferase [Candidatus Saccharibacteria bacterium]
MKIAFFTDCYLDLTGGIVTSINAQKKELEKRGHTVYIFSSSYKKSKKQLKKLKEENIFPVKSCRVWGRGLTPIARKPQIIEMQILEEHPEIANFDLFYVHYEAGCSIAGLRLGDNLGIKTIQTMHGREDIGEQNLVPKGFKTIVATLLNKFHSWYLPHPIAVEQDDYLASTKAASKMWTLMVNHANSADLVFTPSSHFQKKLAYYGVNKPIKVLPNGVDDEFFKTKPTIKTLNPGEPLRIIWHSRVSKEKSIMPFLEALKKVDGKYILNVYGDGNDLRNAKKFVKQNKLNVKFHGPKPFKTIFPEIEKSHLDVLNSYNFDTFGMTLIEAEAAGTPALYVDPDLREIATEKGSILTKSPKPEDVASAINNLIKNPEKIEKMSKEMIKHRNEIKVSKVVDKLEQYISDIM